jgi:hypothetical protein
VYFIQEKQRFRIKSRGFLDLDLDLCGRLWKAQSKPKLAHGLRKSMKFCATKPFYHWE